MSVAYVLDELFLDHRPPGPHPERPARLEAVRDGLRAAGLDRRGVALPPREATEDELGLVHTPGYISDLTRTVPGRSGWLDADTYYSPGTWRAAACAAGAAIDLARAVVTGEHRRGLALVRPPGHHAEPDRAMGFCLLNNAALAAAAAREAGCARVAVLDWDVHHGNGTQAAFWRDPDVMYLSCHQHPFYPGTGRPSEVGEGPGAGMTVNVGLPAGCGDPEYMAVMVEVFEPALTRFRPDLIVISAGFDAYAADPLAEMEVTGNGFRAMAVRVAALSARLCEGRLVATLEGGYDLSGITAGAVGVLDAFDGRTFAAGSAGFRTSGAAPIRDDARAAIDATLSAHARVQAGPAGEQDGAGPGRGLA